MLRCGRRRYSYAECITTPFLRRAQVNLGAHRGIDILGLARAKGLARLSAWIVVGPPRHTPLTPPPTLLTGCSARAHRVDEPGVRRGPAAPERLSCAGESWHTLQIPLPTKDCSSIIVMLCMLFPLCVGLPFTGRRPDWLAALMNLSDLG